MPKADAASVTAVAQGLEDTEETTLIIGDPQPDPAPGKGASASTQDSASTPPAATGEESEDAEVAQAEDDEVDGEDSDEDEDLSPEEVTALEELRDFFMEEARKEAEEAIVPKLQSSYDRQIAQLNRQIQSATQAAQAREKELLTQVREAQLNGLSEAEKAELRQRWDWEDKVAALDAREQELTSYHTELLREAYATEYAEFGLTAEDLEEFETPEEMDEFVQAVQLEYYKQLAELRANGGVLEDEEEDKPRRSAQKSSKKSAPAGASAPTDAGGGSAVPEGQKMATGLSREAMAANIKSGWETISLR